MKAKKLAGWKRCYRGKLPRAEHIVIFDSDENVTLVDSRSEHFYDSWLARRGSRILFYYIVPRVPWRTGWLWPQESIGRAA